MAGRRTEDLLRMVDVSLSELDYKTQMDAGKQVRAENQQKAEELRRQQEQHFEDLKNWVEIR